VTEALTLLLSFSLFHTAAVDTLHSIDLYGLRTTSDTAVRAAVGLRAGDPLPGSLDAIRTRLRQLPGVDEVDLSPVCCSDNGRTILYVGIRERGTPAIAFRNAPDGSARLPPAILATGDRFESALRGAVQRGVTSEDHSRGYALAEDPALRAVQEEFATLATRHVDTVVAVLRHSADARHRALAAQVVAYGPDRQRATRELLDAVRDPSDAVRNNAVRALAVIGEWANEHPDSGVRIPAAPFIALLHSVSWTDRNKGIMVLVPLTASRDSVLLADLRARALLPLTEMARWTTPGHALGPFLVVARIAGVDDGEAFQAFQSGARETVIRRALASAR
jgi:hypothetical protein